SDILSITGLTDDTTITITGGEYAIDGGTFSSQPGTVSANQTIQLQVVSSASPATVNTATVTIGDVSDTFSVTTEALDTRPNPLPFARPTDVAVNTFITSSEITVDGINTEAPVSVSGGFYAIDGGSFVNGAGTVLPGQTVRLQQRSAQRFLADSFT